MSGDRAQPPGHQRMPSPGLHPRGTVNSPNLVPNRYIERVIQEGPGTLGVSVQESILSGLAVVRYSHKAILDSA